MVNTELTLPIFGRSNAAGNAAVEWIVRDGLTSYPDALRFMEDRVAGIAEGTAHEAVLLLEHPPLYTSGTSAKPADLLDARFPVFEAGRGGQFTYHGPGQRVAYVMLDLKARRQDVRAFVSALEAWIIGTLNGFNVQGFTDPARVGVWVKRPDKGAGYEDKIAAIGIRLRKWVSFHGISLNVEPDLTHFEGIVPCGIGEEKFGVTSLVDLGVKSSEVPPGSREDFTTQKETGLPVIMPEADAALKTAFANVFGEVA